MLSVSTDVPSVNLPYELPRRALPAQPLHVALARGSGCSDGQRTTVQTDVDRVGVHARKVAVHDPLVAFAMKVDRHEAHRL